MDVIGIDHPCIDFLAHVDKIPPTNKGTRLKESGWQGGGNVATALVALGRLGIKTGIIGVVGDDDYGSFIKADFERHNVDTSSLVFDKGQSTSFSLCISERETLGRNIMFKHGTIRKLEISDLNKEQITKAKYIHLTGMNPVSKQAAIWAKEAGVKVAIDADYNHKETEENLHLIDVFIASENYYKSMFKDDKFEENCKALQKRGPEVVVFTFGERGCLGVDKNSFFQIPIFKVDVIDTTGAGDVFHGAFIFGLLKGWDIKKTAQFASAVSAIKCTRVGGRAGIPDYNTVDKFLNEGKIDYSEIDKRVEFYRKNP